MLMAVGISPAVRPEIPFVASHAACRALAHPTVGAAQRLRWLRSVVITQLSNEHCVICRLVDDPVLVIDPPRPVPG